MKECYAYVRVSTVRQGEKGTSLGEQRDAIAAFALRHDIRIVEWLEEQETAAKQGRQEFSRLMRAVKRRRERGVIFHKIDRGARNLKDWNDIQELIESGVDIYFAHESLDMTSRGGRLTADLLAVIASDYIRNLRDEVKKGLRGRLKQGIYPLRAPLGYLDRGSGQPKTPDPVRAPLIRQAFELYATGNYTLQTLALEMERRGLRAWKGQKLGTNRLSHILRRPFYVGLIKLKGEIYAGIHEPIISKQVFDRVQKVLDRRLSARPERHVYTYTKLIRCAGCSYNVVGERQKGHVYYRCHTRTCPTTGLRESHIEEAISQTFALASLTKVEAGQIMRLVDMNRVDAIKAMEACRQNCTLRLKQSEYRLSKLTDALLDGIVDNKLFQQKKQDLLEEQLTLREELRAMAADPDRDPIPKFLELATGLQRSYILAKPLEKREILNSATSNLTLTGKKLDITLRSPFLEVANCHFALVSWDTRDEPRTGAQEIEQIYKVLREHGSGATPTTALPRYH
jgi:site-specific DNA recombinase